MTEQQAAIEEGIEVRFLWWRVDLVSIHRFGLHAMLAGVALFLLQMVSWLYCVYQYRGRIAYAPGGVEFPAYTTMCGSAPAMVVPAILAVIAGIGVAVVWDGILDWRALRREQGEGQAMEQERPWGSGAVGRNRFPLLTAMATILRIAGWLVVAGGVILLFTDVVPWITCIGAPSRAQPPRGMTGSPSCGTAILILAPAVISLVLGFCLVAFGEVIGVFRGIEGNTHQIMLQANDAEIRSKLAGGRNA